MGGVVRAALAACCLSAVDFSTEPTVGVDSSIKESTPRRRVLEGS